MSRHDDNVRTHDAGTMNGRPTAVVTVVVRVLLRAAAAAAATPRHVRRACGWLTEGGRRLVVALLRRLGAALAGLGTSLAAVAGPVARLSWRIVTAGSRAVAIGVLKARAEVFPVRGPFAVVPDGSPSVVDAHFELALFYEPALPSTARHAHAIVTVTSTTPISSRSAAQHAEVLMLDRSGSMGRPWSKLRAAKRAAIAAVDALPVGTRFAIVAGNHEATVLFPPGGGLATASLETRAAAAAAVRGVWPEGGTAIGEWLRLARELLAGHPRAIAHALLLTDGRNENETIEELRAAATAGIGHFQCDCLGVGADWDLGEMRLVASSLLGTIDVVPHPRDLPTHFARITRAAATRDVDRVELEVWVPRGSAVTFLRQVAPTMQPLVGTVTSAHTATYPLPAWTTERRDYHLCVDVAPQNPGVGLRAARIRILVDGRPVAAASIAVRWADDSDAPPGPHPAVTHYLEQAAIVDHVQSGLTALDDHDDDRAMAELGAALRMADAGGHTGTVDLLARVVDAGDAHTGQVRRRPDATRADELALATRSTRTLRLDPVSPGGAPADPAS